MSAPDSRALVPRALSQAMRDKRLTSGERRILTYLVMEFGDGDGTDIRPGLSLVAEKLDTTVNATQRARQKLVKLGYLVDVTPAEVVNRQRREHLPNHYRLSVPDTDEPATTQRAEVPPTQGVPPTQRGGDPSAQGVGVPPTQRGGDPSAQGVGVPPTQGTNRPTTPTHYTDPSSARRTGGNAERVIADATDADADEIEPLIDRLHAQHPNIRTPAAWLRKLASNGDLQAHLDQLRADNRSAGTRARLDELRAEPVCTHGVPGGDQPHPIWGTPLCPCCRDEQRRNGNGAAQRDPPPGGTDLDPLDDERQPQP